MSVGVCGCLLLVLSGKAQGNCTRKEHGTGICWMFFVFSGGDDAFQLDP